MQLTITQLYQKMRRQMGPSGWWPADSKEEIVIGAILIQNTNWRNADRINYTTWYVQLASTAIKARLWSVSSPG